MAAALPRGLRRHVHPEEVTITVGGKQALALLQAILDPGSEVDDPDPGLADVRRGGARRGGTAVFVPLHDEDGYRGARRAWRARSDQTRAVMVNSPCNPTGAVIEPAELLKLARLAKQKGFGLVYDDTYAQLTFGPTACSSSRR